jgi:serine/threonine-protein kinase RsbW
MQQGQQIAGITIQAKKEFLPAVAGFIREISDRLGMESNEIERLQLVVEEACLNVIEHAFDPGEQGSFDVFIYRKPGQVVVTVEDRGLPFDFNQFDDDKGSGLGVMLMKAFADEIHFVNLGRNGKRVEITKNLPYKSIEEYISEEEKQGSAALSPVPEDTPVKIRLMEPGDSLDLARCVYRSYGYTYANDDIYYPEKVKEFIESGLQVSHVAVDPDNEVIGHLGIRKVKPDALVGERGQAVVDPRYRGHGLLKKLALTSVAYIKSTGMYGTYSEAVTVHTYSQQAALSIGACETGILLGYTPADMLFKRIQEGERLQRQAAVLLYTRCNEEPLRDIFPPLHHRKIIGRIIDKNKLRRNIINTSDNKDRTEIPSTSQIDIVVQTQPSRAFMLIVQYGMDMVDLVKFRLHELCLHKIDCIYIDLPLSHPATPQFCASLEMLGFFFAGVIPEMADGDVLRLQYLNNVEINLENIQIASDFGKELLDYVSRAGQG